MKKKLSVLIGLLLVISLNTSYIFSQDTNGPTTTPTTEQHSNEHNSGGHDEHKGADLALWSVIPFVVILLCIAILPISPHHIAHWWEQNNNKLLISGILGGIAFGILTANGWIGKIYHTLVFEYVPFIILLGSLFYISGGIVLKGDIKATPVNNLLFLLVGAFLASLIGTTGASMLLIRPLLKTNSERKHVVHTVVFFIFMVSNIGGSLTPLGDPPLFLGYLQGVPFTWTFSLFPEMILSIVVLSIVYIIWDNIQYKKETKVDIKKDITKAEPISIEGQVNFLWLLGVVLSVAFLNENYVPAIKHNPYIAFIREGVMILLILASYYTSNPKLREHNKFTLGPIQEVAYLFIGIFVTMIPALILLESHGKELGVTEPWQFFWAAGGFSSVLDNAPTYLTFLSLAKGLTGAMDVHQILANPEWEKLLKAISVGAVFMGANTYIGNAPNFMVKSVAEENKVNMPSFGGYLLYSFGVLIPLFILITFIFFK
ncbi:MAG TPA: sodium:proton antiporter [Leptospiraceae bacterium]|nr:sodium:proton antiporter [Leptospiraceae bacterium]HMW05451.1 sodium:proton antiporter [Leptospiraceae bacterium]HMX31400.1 sodium:proton antiporter [Leptospiraceae bacterium]HMY30961.1 sodium:proton antiporter [Leptospiraceae bacterium]HMZ63372.1 sodium:proton antiporter [Leptospiraceae bacterium]